MANHEEGHMNDCTRDQNFQSTITQTGLKTAGVNRGFQRWRMLSNVVKSKKYNSECQNSQIKLSKIEPNDSSSDVQFHTLYKIINFNVDPVKPEWVQVFWNPKLCTKEPLDLRLKMISKQFSLDEIAGFDNSGNVRLWPCEELLSYLCSFGMIRDRLKDSIVCELGAGMTALAGLVSAKLGLAKQIILSDGNERSVDNVREIVQENFNDENSESFSNIDVRRIRWENPEDYSDLCHSVEIIICADCLFVPKYHQHLLNTLDNLLVLPSQNQPFQEQVLGSTFLTNNNHNNNNNNFSTNAISSSNISDSSSGFGDSSSSLSDSRSNISDSSSNLLLESNSGSNQSFPPYSFSPPSVSSSSSTSSASASSSPYHKTSAQVFIVAPQRDNTLESFIQLVRFDGRFRCFVLDHFDEAFFSQLSDPAPSCGNIFLDQTRQSSSSVENLAEDYNNHHPYDIRNNHDSSENCHNKHTTDYGINPANRDHPHHNSQHRPFLLILARI